MKLFQRRHFLARMASWAAAGVLVAIAGCGGGNEQSGKQEVEFWTMQLQPKFTDYFDQLIADFETANPDVDVVWIDVPWADMQSKILTAVSAGTAPDVVNLNPDFASQLASRNAWLPLDEQLTSEEQAVYLPKIWKATTLNGSSFGFPWYLTTRVTLFNTDLMEQAGIDEPPSTYAELADAAKQIKETTGKYAFFISFVAEDAADVLQSFIQMGVPLVDDAGNAAFNTLEGKAVFQYWTDLYQQDLLPREVLTQGHRRAIELYQAGETVFLASGAEALDNIANNAPDIAAATQTAPQITGTTGKKNVAAMNLVVPRSTDVPEAAVKFAMYVTNNDNQLSFAQAANVLPSTAAAIDGTLTQAPADATPIEVARAVSASQLADAEVLIPALEDAKKLQKVIYDNLQAAMLGDKTVDEAVSDAADEWNNR
ncbi:sugar ABC transporter substrate-binding protein [Leptolyngbyaceae cyanobacterium CCMR0082]|uniref:Sugar ABC transporter substrate-binding protein n=1 Tax=Adonisia turfae CCMR0082 TaxID=2304604 RepID=A0A6M0S7R0_9CYAN|nr:sugar ABC transporter substrate-binding protein [Adonisia turfae]NEZ64518.1 sugar ABC transporter substrate-binding protein [Adonisia turfae CCMR0082]